MLRRLYCISFSTGLSVGSLQLEYMIMMDKVWIINGKSITWNETENRHEYHSQESEGGDPGENLPPPVSGHHVLYRGEEKIHV